MSGWPPATTTTSSRCSSENASRSRPALDGPAHGAPRVGRGGRRAPGERPGVGHRPRPSWCFIHGGGQNAHTWDTVALALGPAPGGRRPARARPLRLARRRAGPSTRRAMADDVATVIDRAGPRRPHGGGHVARRHDRRSPWPPAIPSWCRGWPWSTSPRGSTTTRARTSPPSWPDRSPSPPSTRSSSGPSSSTPPGRSRPCAGGCCTTRCSARTGPGPGATSWAGRRAPAGSTSTRLDFGSLWDDLEAIDGCRCCWSGAASPRWSTTPTRPSSAAAGPPTRWSSWSSDAGHSIQGDQPVELARILAEFFWPPLTRADRRSGRGLAASVGGRHRASTAPPAASVGQARRRAPRRCREARWKVISSRTASGTSSRSGPLRTGRTTVVSPARWAASTFWRTPPMGSTRPCRVTSPVMPTTERTGTSRSRLTRAVVMVTPADGPSLGMAPAGTCRWNRLPAKTGRVDAQRLGVRAHVGEGDLRRLLHDVAQLAGEGQALGPVHHRGLDVEHVATGSGDGQAGGHAGHRGAVGGLEEEAGAGPASPGRRRRRRSAASPPRPTAMRAATLRSSRPSSRSSERTPASRV